MRFFGPRSRDTLTRQTGQRPSRQLVDSAWPHLVVGEVHQARCPQPVEQPSWLILPERGLYTGIAVLRLRPKATPKALIGGVTRDPITGKLWETEHGPTGGDELNRLVKLQRLLRQFVPVGGFERLET